MKAPIQPMKRDSFVFYRSFKTVFSDLPETDALALFKALLDYALDGQETQLSGHLHTIFELIRPQIDSNNRKYYNGKSGGRPLAKAKPNDNQSITTKEPNNNQNVTTEEPSHNQKGTKTQPNANDNVHSLVAGSCKDINTATTAAGGKADYPKDTDALIQEAAKRAYLMSVEEAARFINDGQSSGWTIDGRPVKNWRKLLDYCKLKQTPAQRHMAVEESRRRKQGLPAVQTQEEKLVRLKDGRLIPESQSVHNVGTLPDGTPFDEYVEGSFP